jgi:hypothetical protein
VSPSKFRTQVISFPFSFPDASLSTQPPRLMIN